MSGIKKTGDWRSKCSNLVERCTAARKKGYFTDITFSVGPTNIKFQAHKSILACGSKVFEAMFYGSFLEWKDPILIPDVNADAFSILLSYIYGEKIAFPDIATSFQTCAAADKYLLPELKAEAEKYISNIVIQESTVWKALGEAIRLDMQTIKTKCFDFISRNAEHLLHTNDFLDADICVVKSIVQMNSLNMSEFQLMQAIAEWGQANARSKESMNELLKPLLGFLNFRALTVSEFCSFTDRFPDLIENSDALAIIKSLLNPTIYKMPLWCSTIDRNRCLTPPALRRPVDIGYYAFYSA